MAAVPPSGGALHTVADAPPPPPPPPPHPGGLGELDLEGLLTHPHLGVAVLQYLGDDTLAATKLRRTCRGARDAVAAHRWHDTTTRVVWPGRWRAAFPAATAANVSRDRGGPPSTLTDADFVHLRGLRTLAMRNCNQATITDGAFAHLAGIRTLYMSGCSQATITDGAFAHLRGIHTLNMCGCSQATITDAAFVHLAGIHTLEMRHCRQATITDGAFAHLAGIHTLDMRWCSQAAITAACRARLQQAGIAVLTMY